jgi:hypothetical protein
MTCNSARNSAGYSTAATSDGCASRTGDGKAATQPGKKTDSHTFGRT